MAHTHILRLPLFFVLTLQITAPETAVTHSVRHGQNIKIPADA